MYYIKFSGKDWPKWVYIDTTYTLSGNTWGPGWFERNFGDTDQYKHLVVTRTSKYDFNINYKFGSFDRGNINVSNTTTKSLNKELKRLNRLIKQEQNKKNKNKKNKNKKNKNKKNKNKNKKNKK